MELAIQSIGHIIKKQLENQAHFQFFGQTSKGIFFKTKEDKIGFLSTEIYAGPFTLIIAENSSPLPHCTKETNIFLSTNTLIFQNPTMHFQLTEPQLWMPAIDFSITSHTQLEKNCNEAVSLLSPISENSLLPLVTMEISHPSSNHNKTALSMAQFQTVVHYLSSYEENKLVTALIDCIGFGGGLTPSGDDFICGVLLAEQIIKKRSFSDEFKIQLNTAANQRTTLVSANLIEAAFESSADERIINALKEICADEINHIDAILDLKTWGNSSGLDTLTGIITSIIAN